LPITGEFDPDRVFDLIGSDKKRIGGKTSWVLLEPAGGVTISREVTNEHVRSAIEAVHA
jgi:3-dehydroquinate synthetase